MLRNAQRSISRWSNSAWHLPCALSTARRGLATTQPRQGAIHKLVFAAVTDIEEEMATGKRKWEVIRAPEIVSLAREHPMVGKRLKDLNSASIQENSEWRQTDAYRGLMELLNQRFRLLGPEDIKEDQLTEERTSRDESNHSAARDESSAAETEVEDKSEHDSWDSDVGVESREQEGPSTNQAGTPEEPLDNATSNSKQGYNPDTELVRVFAESRPSPTPCKDPEADKAKVKDKKIPGVKWMSLDLSKTSADVGDIEQEEAAQHSPEETRVKLEETYQNALYLISLLPTNKGPKSEFLYGNQRDADPDEVHRRRDMLNRIGIREITKLRGRAGLGAGGSQDLESPEHRTRYIHIAGTKGKGSVAHYITSILTSPVGLGAGRIGTYTSPHINTVRERIKIDGEMLSEEEFTTHFFRFWRALRRNESREQDLPKDLFIPNTWMKSYDKKLHGPPRKIAVRSAPLKNLYAQEEIKAAARMPFLFNFMTLLAMRVFQSMRVKTAVVECGIGAEYDTTNILIPPSNVTVGVVTAIDYEHTSMLGKTLPEIAWHKTGVFKPGASAVVVRPPISATTYDFMRGMTQGAYGLPKPPPSSAVDMEGRGDALEQRNIDQADGNALMGVIWGRAIDRAVKKLVDVPFDVGIPDESAPPDEMDVGGPVEKLNMAVASLAVSEHFHQIQTSRTKAAKIINNSDTSPSDEPPSTLNPYQARVRSLSLSPYISRGRWQAMIKPTHLAAMAFSKTLPGRREIYQSPHDQDTTIYLDGAHTTNSLRAVGQWFQDKVAEAQKNNTTGTKPLAAIVFDQRDPDRDPIALLSALIEPLRSPDGLFNEDTLAFIGIIRPTSGSNDVFDNLQRHFEAEYPWLRFRNFEHVDHATRRAASKARDAVGGKSQATDWWPRPVHVLFTGSFSLTSRPEMRDSIPVLFNMPPRGSEQQRKETKGPESLDAASHVDAVLAGLVKDAEKRARAPLRRKDALRKRRMAVKNQQARIQSGGAFAW
ncbi:hypothetical protein PpBr36_00697 [Pyricularia pennisetigena]|uniref:hypothetical protein n=1 Tax=Pyricularia pennisetigena TaxID=1578925 RepID=UPI0011531917|nr:hypothetical protein PpBr36_00697 [Pyricularia pennisetigena]TLS28953.1 hypothetical protein PpBr36_00697 [Pyricularia pennisetigena]